MSDILNGLNEEQKLGVMTTEGPVLILAGAGSGKTRVLTHRVAYLISEKGVDPYNIMAITFTNKAAGEMRERVDRIAGAGAGQVWVATFHSTCVRILRRYADRLGYGTNFSIYDADDSKALMKEILKYLEIDTKMYREKTFLNVISSAKDELVSTEEFANMSGDYNHVRQAQVYREYQNRLKANNAMDFDDLIMKTVELLKFNPDVLDHYRNRFRYIMVDEYQDTNTAQFELIRLLASGRENLCVVGDDDQSIYKFRGANIYNILNFEQYYPDATVIKLEQNYRSTQTILDVANSVISNNKGRKSKALWTDKGEGDMVRFKQFDSAYEEADFIVREIGSRVRYQGMSFSDFAILYRTNAQSRILEEKMLNANMPYKIVGGVNFYSRKEIKDIIAYLKTIDNAADEISVRRIINEPKRGIGATSLTKVSNYAFEHDTSFYSALNHAAEIPGLARASAKIAEFTAEIGRFRQMLMTDSLTEVTRTVLEDTGYLEALRLENTPEAQARLENLDEFLGKIDNYEETADTPTLSGLLEEVALVADVDSLDGSEDYVVLMTLHSAKGLEFDNVYMPGMEDGLFPSQMSIFADEDGREIEEERRLCYVGITRARKTLTMTAARMRMLRGEMQYGAISRFVKEIPENMLDGSLWEPKPRDSYMSEPRVSPIFAANPARRPAASGYGRSDAGTGETAKTGAEALGSIPGLKKGFGTKIEKKELDYGPGDRVKHAKFGTGTVAEIKEGGRDFEVSVDFDDAGRKKMFASFAKLVKL